MLPQEREEKRKVDNYSMLHAENLVPRVLRI